jgi:translation initiation factor 5
MMRNIGRDDTDSSYRYKMPALITKIEGRGNGIKTVILNIVEVSKALHIHPSYPTKYFGIELGAQSKFQTDRAILNGAHEVKDLHKLLDKFIQSFVLCPKCSLPEIKMIVKKEIKIDCASCGYHSVLKSQPKLISYILKNSDKKKNKEKPKISSPTDFTTDKLSKDDEYVWFSDTSLEAIAARKAEEFNNSSL